MGKLLSLLAIRDDASTCCSPQKYDVYLDFESEKFARVYLNAARYLPLPAFIEADWVLEVLNVHSSCACEGIPLFQCTSS